MFDDASALKQRMHVGSDILAHSQAIRPQRHGDVLPPRSALHELQRGAVLFSTSSLVLATLLLLLDAGIVGVSSWEWAHAGPTGGGHGGDDSFRHTFLVVIVLGVLRIVLFIPLSRWAVKGRRSLLPVLCEIIGLGLLITKTVWLWLDTDGLQVQLRGANVRHDNQLPGQDDSAVLSDLYIWWDLLLLSIASSTAQIAWFVYRRAKGSIGGPSYTVLLDDLVLGGLAPDRSRDHHHTGTRTATATAGSAIAASDDANETLVISEVTQAQATQAQAQAQEHAHSQVHEQPSHHRQMSGYHLSLRDLSLREGVAQIAGAWQLRVSEFRLRWRAKWSNLLERINAAALGEGAGGAGGTSAAFHLLLRLYAHDDVSAELNALALSRPSEVRFYLPQLCSFLLHGSAEQRRADELEACLLKCARASPLFALRLHWFLQAFCRLAEFIQAEGAHRGAASNAKSGRRLDVGRTNAGARAGTGAIGAASLAVASTSAAPAPQAAVAPPPWLSDVCALMEAVQAQAGAEAHVGLDGEDATAQASEEQRMQPQPLQKTATASFWHTLQFVEKLTALTEVLMATPRKREIETETSAEAGGKMAIPQGNSTTSANAGPRWHSAKPRTDALRYALEELDAMFVAQENEHERGEGAHDGEPVGTSGRRDSGCSGASCPLLLPMQVRGPTTETPVSSPGRSFSVSISPARARNRSRARDVDPCLSLSRIVRLHAAESLTFSTNEHVPFLVCCEVIDMDKRCDDDIEPVDGVEGGQEGDGDSDRNTAGRSWSSSVAGIKASMAQRFQQLRGRREDGGASELACVDGNDEEALDEPLLQQLDDANDDREEAADQLAPLRSSTKQQGTGVNTGKPRSWSWAADSDGAKSDHDNRHHTSAIRASTFGAGSARRRTDMSLPWDGQSVEDVGRPRSQSDDSTRASVVHMSEQEADANAPHLPQSLTETAAITVTDDDDALVEADHKSDGYGDSSDGDTGLTGRRARGGVVIFSELWRAKEARVRAGSKWGRCSGWRLVPLIVKGGDEFLRQEQLAAQLIAEFDRIFRAAREPLFLRPYAIVATSPDAGLIEAVPDTISLDALRQKTKYSSTLAHRQRLRQVFISMFGPEGSVGFACARDNFVESLAAYSIVCYLLQIKDRHNGNILLDSEGHLIHIDFGFLLGTSPGGNFGFEGAPFKLTDEWVELMDGPRSATFRHFRYLCVRAFVAARAQYHKVTLLVEMALVGSADLPCFTRHGPRQTVSELVRRFRPDITSQFELSRFVNGLIDQSLDSWSTKWYDKYQRCCVGVF